MQHGVVAVQPHRLSRRHRGCSVKKASSVFEDWKFTSSRRARSNRTCMRLQSWNATRSRWADMKRLEYRSEPLNAVSWQLAPLRLQRSSSESEKSHVESRAPANTTEFSVEPRKLQFSRVAKSRNTR